MARKRKQESPDLLEALASAIVAQLTPGSTEAEPLPPADKLTALLDHFETAGEFTRAEDGTVAYTPGEPEAEEAQTEAADEKPDTAKEQLLQLLSGGKSTDEAKGDKPIDVTDVKPGDWLTRREEVYEAMREHQEAANG